jgi:NitT/TauT family transport system substrate-binding protein
LIKAARLGCSWAARPSVRAVGKFQLDWRFEGPAALFLLPVAKGYFKAAGWT